MHYSTKCTHRNLARGGGDDLASQLELDFALLSCLESTVRGTDWYLDFGASYHMTGNKECFSTLEDKDLQMHIELWYDGKYSATIIGVVTIKRIQAPIFASNFLFCT